MQCWVRALHLPTARATDPLKRSRPADRCWHRRSAILLVEDRCSGGLCSCGNRRSGPALSEWGLKMLVQGDDLLLTPKELRIVRAKLLRVGFAPESSPEERGVARAWAFIVGETLKAVDR